MFGVKGPEAFIENHGFEMHPPLNHCLQHFHEHGSNQQSIKGYGVITFGKHKKAPFLCLSDGASRRHTLSFVSDMLKLTRQDFPEPSLVLSVTGGALSFDLSPHLEEALRKGLGNVVRRTNAWVVSGGTHTGVMKLTGSIMNAYYSGHRHIISPTIGIATLGVLTHRKLLSKTEDEPKRNAGKSQTALNGGTGETASSVTANDKESDVHLDPNHTHFILIDDGTVNDFGREIAFRADFEQEICAEYDASAVTVVIQGGPNTLKTALEAVQQNTPLVIVNNSGKAADVLAYAYNFLHGAGSQYSGHTARGLREKVEEKFPKESQENPKDEFFDHLVRQALDSVLDRSKVHIFDLHRGGTEEFENQIFAAVSTAKTGRPAKLKTALTFDRIEVAKALVNEAPLEDKDNPEELLKQALIQDRPEFVRLFLSAGAKASKLKPKQNTNQKPGGESDKQPDKQSDARQDGSEDVAMQEQFHSALEELYKAEVERNVESHLLQLVQLFGTNKEGQRRALSGTTSTASVATQSDNGRDIGGQGKRAGRFRPRRMGKIMWRLVGINNENLKSLVVPSKPSGSMDEKQAINMLFFWAVCLDRFELARVLWLRVDRPIMKALIASRILLALSKHRALSGAHLAEEKELMVADAKRCEELAIGVLQECHNEDTQQTRQLLTNGDSSSPLHVAFFVRSLQFLSHPATQKVLTSKWSGELDHQLSFVECFVAYVVPFSTPIYIFANQRSEDIPEIGDDCKAADKGIDELFKEWLATDKAATAPTDTSQKRQPKLLYEIVRQFYNAPITRFVADTFSHLGLSLVFSYYVLNETPSHIYWVEFLLMAWFFAIFEEELRQFAEDGFKKYKRSLWNKLDILLLALFVSGLAVRLSHLSDSSTQLASKTIQAFTAFGLWIRFMRYYAASPTLGPKLIMITEMTKNVLTFIFLILIFIIGYGVASQSLLFPNSAFSAKKAVNVLYRPYFQMYGELELDALEADSGCVGDLPFSDCPNKEVRLVPALFAVYILITNVLLINLLIAMFNDTYIKVQVEAEALWRKQNFELYDEFRNKSPLPAPLSILWITPIFCRDFILACRQWSCLSKRKSAVGDSTDCPPNGGASSGSTSNKNNSDDTAAEPEFEERCAARYAEHADKMARQQTNASVLDMKTRVQRMQRDMLQIQDRLVRSRTHHERRPHYLTDRTSGRGEETSKDPNTVQEEKVLSFKPNWVPTSAYPDESGTKRFPLNPEKVPWSVELPSYKPVKYTADKVKENPGADPEKPKGIAFNQVTTDAVGKTIVNRKSCLGIFEIEPDSGRPINPFGRTGMRGRGQLFKWGVNHAVDVVVTRWKRADDGSVLERNGKPVMEFVAVYRDDVKVWSIPGTFFWDREDTTSTVKRVLDGKVLNKPDGSTKDTSKEKKKSNVEKGPRDELLEEGHQLRTVYSKDDRNTDNAWVETTCVNFHDAAGFLTKTLTLKRDDGEEQEQKGEDKGQDGEEKGHKGEEKERKGKDKVRWLPMISQWPLFASHSQILREVANHHDAYF